MHSTKIIALIMFGALIMSSAKVAFSDETIKETCSDTKEINISDFVDPNGLPGGRDGPKSLTVDPTLIIFRVHGSPADPPMIPAEWKITGRAIMDNLTFYENGTSFDYRIIRFDNPVTLCDLARGWEAWERYRKGTNDILYHGAYFVFLRNGEQRILMNDLVLTLGPGVSPDEFKNRIFNKELVARENSSGERTGYLDQNAFDANMDLNTGLWKVRVQTADGIFPLRAANRIASYGTYGQAGWISRVDLVFRSLVSQVRFKTEFEQLQLSGPAIPMQKGQPISVPQLYAPGIRLRVLVDIARDPKGQPLFRVLTDASEYSEKLIKAFEPKIEKWQMANMGPGCTKDIVPAPTKKYERTIFSCTFSVLSPDDFAIKPLSFRLASVADGKDYVIESNGENLLLRVFALRHKNQEDGVSGVRPLPAVPYEVSRKLVSIAKLQLATPPAEPVVTFLSKYLVPPVEKFTMALKENPWEVIRTKVFVFFTFASAVIVALLLFFSRWFRYPSFAKLFGMAIWFLVIGVLGGILLPVITLFLGTFGLRFFLYFVSLRKSVKNPTLEVLAGKWHIALPTDPAALVAWALSDKRTMLERLFAALSVRDLRKRALQQQNVGEDSELIFRLEAIEDAGLEVILTPFAALVVRREMRKREA